MTRIVTKPVFKHIWRPHKEIFLVEKELSFIDKSSAIPVIISKQRKQFVKESCESCDWFVDNKLSIQFGEDKTKERFSTYKRKIIKIPKYLKVSYS